MCVMHNKNKYSKERTTTQRTQKLKIKSNREEAKKHVLQSYQGQII